MALLAGSHYLYFETWPSTSSIFGGFRTPSQGNHPHSFANYLETSGHINRCSPLLSPVCIPGILPGVFFVRTLLILPWPYRGGTFILCFRKPGHREVWWVSWGHDHSQQSHLNPCSLVPWPTSGTTTFDCLKWELLSLLQAPWSCRTRKGGCLLEYSS